MKADHILGAGNLVLSAALIPSVIAHQPPNLWTCFVTAFVLATFTGSYLALKLWYGVIGTAFATVMWTILLMMAAGLL